MLRKNNKSEEVKASSSYGLFQQKGQKSNLRLELSNPDNEQTVREKYDAMQGSDDPHTKVYFNQFLNLIKSLESISEDVLLISIGCAISRCESKKEQQLPTYIRNIAKTKSVRVLLIDPYLIEDGFPPPCAFFPDIKKADDCPQNRYEYQPIDALFKLKIEAFACCLPYNDALPVFYQDLQKVIETILSKESGQVFIANHTQAYSLEDLPEIGMMYNNVKKTHPNSRSFQLYTQGGSGNVRYYLDKSYDNETSKWNERGMKYDSISDVFYSCNKIVDLASIPEFTASPLGKKELLPR